MNLKRMKTELTVIGCGDAFNSGGRSHTCFHVRSSVGSALIDCGATAPVGLRQHQIDGKTIDLIVITHFHGDHYGGLPFLLLEAAVYRREKRLTIVSPPGCRERLEKLLDLLYPGSAVLEKLDVRFESFRSDKPIQIGGFKIEAFPVKHTPATLPHGIRLTVGDCIIGYSGDTEWTPVLKTLADQADLFICECNFYQKQVRGHLNYKTLKEHIGQWTCKRLLLTHLDTEMLQHAKQLSIPCAYDGLTLEIINF